MIWLLLCFYVYLSSSLTKTQGPPVSLALALSKARTTGVGNVTSLYKHRGGTGHLLCGALGCLPRRGQSQDQLFAYILRRALKTVVLCGRPHNSVPPCEMLGGTPSCLQSAAEF